MELKRGNRGDINGQTTVFIILAIVIVAIIAIYFVFRSNLSGEKVEPEVEPIYSFIENCIKETGENAVYNIGQSGGYYIVSEDFVRPNFSDYAIPYYAEKGINYMPSKQEVEQEISRYIDELLYSCILNFIDFSDFEIKQELINVTTKIQEGKVVINADYPLTIKKGDKTYLIQKFENIEIPVRLNTIYNVAEQITLEEIQHPKDICFSCISDFASKNEVYINIMDYDDEIIIFTIIDSNSKIKGEDYEFVFANKYEAS